MGGMKTLYTEGQNVMLELKKFLGDDNFNLLYNFVREEVDGCEQITAGREVARAFKEMMESIE